MSEVNQSAGAGEQPEAVHQPPKPVSSVVPDYFKHATVFGVLPVDDTSGEPRTGISFKLESGEIVWLNLSCTDAEWLCVTLRSWMSDYEEGQKAKTAEGAAKQ